MPEDEEIEPLEKEPKEDKDLQEPPKVKKERRHIKPRSPEPIETVTLRSHKNENHPRDELVNKIPHLRNNL